MTRPITQLAWPLAASLALHLGAGWFFSSGKLQFLPRQGKNLTLTVTLAGNQPSEPRKIAQAGPPSVPPLLSSAATPSTDSAVTEKARFLVAPDLSALEDIAVPLSGKLTLRLHVSSLGTVDRVEVIKSDPVPKELLDGLLEKLRQAQLVPALAGSQPVASTLDLVIGYETTVLVPLKRDP